MSVMRILFTPCQTITLRAINTGEYRRKGDNRGVMMKARTINNALHRYLGYFFFGMTVVYAFSGLALNHIHDWTLVISCCQKK